MAHNMILVGRTKDELGIDIDDQMPVALAAQDQRSVFMRCSECNDIFIRPVRLMGVPHACRPRKHLPYRDHPNKLPRLECKRVHKDAKYPYRKRATDAGYDLFSVKKVIVPAFSSREVPTGIKLVCPEGYYYTIEGRSGLRSKGILPYRGIIDAGYTGDTCVFMTNATPKRYVIAVGDKIAQILLHRVNDFDIAPVAQDEDFSPDYVIRGEKGFGSSGK